MRISATLLEFLNLLLKMADIGERIDTPKPAEDLVPPPVEQNKEKAQVGPQSLAEFIDINGQIRIIIAQRVSISISAAELPVGTLIARADINLPLIDKVESQFTIWRDPYNVRRYVLVRNKNSISFSTPDELITAMIKDFRSERSHSETILREPSRGVFSNDERCYIPESLGIPFDELLNEGAVDDVMRNAIKDACLPIANVQGAAPSFAVANVYEYGPRGLARAKLMNHARVEMPMVLDAVDQYARAVSNIYQMTQEIVRKRNSNEFILPTYPFNAIQSPFDNFRLSGYSLRHEFVLKATGLNIPLLPISTTELFNATNVQLTRASFLNQVINTNFDASMTSEIAAYFTSLILPGEILMELDFSDLSSDVSDMQGVANRVYEWAGNAAFKLNASKTKAIICGYRYFVDKIPQELPRIEVSGIFIPYVDQVENLGVIIDSKFTWKLQVEKVVKRVNCAIYSLNFFRQFTSFELRKRLVS